MYLAEAKDGGTKFALKVQQVKKISEALHKQMHEELAILYKLDHPYICQYVESFEDEKYIYIIMEFCPGKVLMDRLDEQGRFTEFQAAKCIYKIIEGMNHVHHSSIVHRDLKPENIIIDDNGDPKIIDFGLGKDTNNNTRLLKSFVGSKLYMAPEILMGQAHSNTCDMWSIGIILFLIISGSYPFDLSNLEKEIIEAPILFPKGTWADVSLLCQDFIRKLLDKSSSTRISAAKALEHPWFKILENDETYKAEIAQKVD